MKAETHPEYNQVKIKCVCGNEVETGSTGGEMTVDICSKCHPFFTGTQNLVDTRGRIDKFKKKLEAAGNSGAANAPKAKKADKPAETASETTEEAAE